MKITEASGWVGLVLQQTHCSQSGFMELDNDNSNSRDQFNDESRIVQKQLFWYDFRNFPDKLLIDILARLPVKSIFMFKCVCKHWQTLISDPFFCRFYHSILNSNAAASPFRLLDRYSRLPNIKDFVNLLGPEIHSSTEFSVLFLSTPEEQRRYDQFRVLDISNGLILCCPLEVSVYYICDPLTRIWITIPRRGPRYHYKFYEGLITRVNEDHMLTGYTVARLNLRSIYLNIEMFSSETGNWIVYNVPSSIPIRLQEFGNGPIHCYGALHWPVYHHNGTYCLLAFDPFKDPKSVRLISFPEDRDLECEHDNCGMSQLCGESRGTLRYFEVADDSTKFYLFTMWAMKDYEKGEWCCEFKVRRSDIHSSDPELSNWLLELDGWFRPLSFHPLNQNVVYLWCMEPKRIVSYDLLNRRLDFVCKSVDVRQLILKSCMIPFVLPRWPVDFSIATVNS